MRGVLFILALVLTLAACGDDDRRVPIGSRPSTPAEWLARAQGAIDSAPGYRIDMTGHNMVLPRWGGIDAATIDISAGGITATGAIERTGDGTYAVFLRDGQTYFKRSTCDHFARIPGGGMDVLEPFLWGRTDALVTAEDAEFDPPSFDGLFIGALLDGLGHVQIEIDGVTSWPQRISKYAPDSSGRQTATLLVSRLDQEPDVPRPPVGAPDQGPGGDPC